MFSVVYSRPLNEPYHSAEPCACRKEIHPIFAMFTQCISHDFNQNKIALKKEIVTLPQLTFSRRRLVGFILLNNGVIGGASVERGQALR